MIITTTPTIEGLRIVEYRTIVFGEVIVHLDEVRDVVSGISSFFGGRTGLYENGLIEARTEAINEMMGRAMSVGANAIVGISMDYEMLGTSNSPMMVTVSGTAVVAEMVGGAYEQPR